MATESRAEFARRMGWNRSSVTRAAQDGRVVMQGELVDVDASLAKINALASPRPHHVAHTQQLADQRKKKTPTANAVAAAMHAMAPHDQTSVPRESAEEASLRQKIATADKIEHEAEKARMERETMAGNLVPREEVAFAFDDLGATMRSLMDNFADRITPIVHPLETFDERHAANSEFAQEVLQTMHDRMMLLAERRKQE